MHDRKCIPLVSTFKLTVLATFSKSFLLFAPQQAGGNSVKRVLVMRLENQGGVVYVAGEWVCLFKFLNCRVILSSTQHIIFADMLFKERAYDVV